MSIDRNGGYSRSECGASWNEGDDGECECTKCSKRRWDIARAEFDYDAKREDELLKGLDHV